MAFYHNYVALCRKKKLSPSAAAEAMGFKRSIVTRWSNGAMPHKSTLHTIADFFSCSVEDLTRENKNPAPTVEDGLSEFDNAILDFVHSLPYEQLRGILVGLRAPKELLDALDREAQKE